MYLFKLFLLAPLFIFSLYANDLKEVSLQLQWKYQFQFAGYIIAKEKGFYKDIGLNVNLKEWQHNINMIDELINQTSQYAVARPTSMIDISKGKEIVYLASIFQSSPLVLLADKSSGITTVKDFVGKRMMSTGDMNADTSFVSMMLSQGIDIKNLIIQKPSFNPKDLMDGTTDLMASYISNEPFVLREMGGEPIVFSPKDYGFDFYNDIVTTSKEYLKNNPTEVKDFKDATLKGWEYAFANIQESVNILYTKYNTQNKSKDALLYEAKELKKLAYYETNKIGTIKSDKLEKIYDLYKLLGLVKNNINLNQVIYNDTSLDVYLNKEEKEYLQNKKSITMCIDPNWMPFEGFDKNANHIGMSADYFKIFEETLNTTFDVVQTNSWTQSVEYAKQRKCDLFSLVMQTPERKKYMNLTTPYLSVPLVVTTKLDGPFINDVSDLLGKKIGIPREYAFIEILKNKYPKLNIIEVENIDDGLDKVNKGELFAYVDTIATVGYKFQTKYSGELKIAGKISDNWELGIAVRNDDPLLLSILQKAINNISNEKRREILNKWVAIKYEKGIDYTIIYKIIALFLVILLFIAFFYNKQKKLKEKLEVAYAQVKKLAVIDKLTNLYNRHMIDEALEKEKKRADRYETTFGTIMLDLDYFKNVNDTYGHHVGDLVLKEFANLLSTSSRDTDLVGRWGGKEFLIILPQIDKDSILEFADNLRKTIEEHTFSNIGKMTASIGATIYENKESTEETVKRADDALFISKNNGRNQVSFK